MLTLVLGIWLTIGLAAVVLLTGLAGRWHRQADDAAALLDYGFRPQELDELRLRWRPSHREHGHHHTGQHATVCRPVAVGLVPLPLVLAGAGQ